MSSTNNNPSNHQAQQKDLKKEQNKSKGLFSCCGCGDKEVQKEVAVDLNTKKPEPVDVPICVPVRPVSVISTSAGKPRVNFTYSSKDHVTREDFAQSLEVSRRLNEDLVRWIQSRSSSKIVRESVPVPIHNQNSK